MNILEKEEDINISDLLIYIFKNSKSILVISLALFIIGMCIFFNFYSFKGDSYFSKYSLSIENDQIKEVLSSSTILNMQNFVSAAKKSNIELNDISDNFVSSFSIIPGEIKSNQFINYVNNEDFNSLAKNIAIQPAFLEEYFQTIIEHSYNYRTIIVDRQKLLISDDSLDLFITNLIESVNQRLNNEFDLSQLRLSNLNYKNDLGDRVSWTIYANEYLGTMAGYIDALKEFSFSAPAVFINLDQLDDRLSIISSEFNQYLSTHEYASKHLTATNNIHIASLKLELESLENIIKTFDTNNRILTGVSDENNVNESLAIDADSFSRILGLGNELSNAQAKVKYVDLFYKKNSEMLSIIKENELLKYKSEMADDISPDYLNDSIISLSNDINDYMKVVTSLGEYSVPIKLLSYNSTEKVSYNSQLIKSIIIIIITSILISISLILLRGAIIRFQYKT